MVGSSVYALDVDGGGSWRPRRQAQIRHGDLRTRGVQVADLLPHRAADLEGHRPRDHRSVRQLHRLVRAPRPVGQNLTGDEALLAHGCGVDPGPQQRRVTAARRGDPQPCDQPRGEVRVIQRRREHACTRLQRIDVGPQGEARRVGQGQLDDAGLLEDVGAGDRVERRVVRSAARPGPERSVGRDLGKLVDEAGARVLGGSPERGEGRVRVGLHGHDPEAHRPAGQGGARRRHRLRARAVDRAQQQGDPQCAVSGRDEIDARGLGRRQLRGLVQLQHGRIRSRSGVGRVQRAVVVEELLGGVA